MTSSSVVQSTDIASPLVPKVIHDVGEVPLVLYSEVRGPLAAASFLRRSLVMAELAMIAYNDEAEARRAARAIGFPAAKLLEHDGSQAYWFGNEHDVVIACRGTEPTEWDRSHSTMAPARCAAAVMAGMSATAPER